MGPRRRAPPVGRFKSREELTCHIWSMHRQQVYPNKRAIAESCGVTMEAVKAIIETEEGLEAYLQHGCLTGSE